MIDSSTVGFAKLFAFAIVFLLLFGIPKLCSSSNNTTNITKDNNHEFNNKDFRNINFKDYPSHKEDITTLYERKLKTKDYLLLPESKLTKKK